MKLALGLVLALISTLALNWGFFQQHDAAGSLPRLKLVEPLRSLRSLLTHRRWLLGSLVGGAGFVLYVVALKLAPLSLVQAVSAGGIGVLALLVRLGPSGRPFTRRESTAIVIAVGGLALLGASLAGTTSAGAVPQWGTVSVWLVALALAAAATAGTIKVGVPAATALGVATGLLNSAGDIATKAVVDGNALVFIPAVIAAHGLGFVCLQLAFQRGGALLTIGLSTLFTNAVPIAAGTLLFSEHLPSGALGAARILAFALVVVAAILLAAPEPRAGPGPGT